MLLEYGTDKEIAENIWKFDDLSFFEKSWISLTHSPFGMPGIGGASPATVYNLEGNLVPYGSSIQGRAEATGYMMGAAMVFSAAVALYTLDKMEYIINKPFNDFLADIEMQRQRLSALSNAWEQRGWITAEKASLIYEKLARAHELGLKPATDGDWINQAKWMSTYATKYTDRFGKVWDFGLLLPPGGWELMLKTFGQIR